MQVTRLFAFALPLAIGLSMTFTIQAADEPAKKQRPEGGRQAELLKRFDKNGDGKLDDAEKAAAQEAMKGKGRPGQPEPGKGVPNRVDIIKKFDKNGDGKLDDAEKAAAQEAKGKGRPGAPPKKGDK